MDNKKSQNDSNNQSFAGLFAVLMFVAAIVVGAIGIAMIYKPAAFLFVSAALIYVGACVAKTISKETDSR